ncbi:FAD-binding oxidoreductase [Nonomuraea sp. LPB2021202275-12-8]|uniref:FAD-binding oxidoreductase n=1 Tax=Nonomuraea sp. LPB2021202275-12-8 TaxID=3120159 RepID=UPI00300CBF9E
MTNNDLRRAVKGGVLLPGEDGFEQAAKPWNLAVDQPVAAVVEAQDADDVAAVVGHAARAGLAVAAQPCGHGASGDVDGVILLRTKRLDSVTVRPGERLARVGAGVQWGSLQSATATHGLTGPAGSSPVVSVTGFSLGGGLSWFGRKHGWAAAAVSAFDVVTADGDQLRVTAESDPDLFWALRGGGGDFALVTALEIGLFPAPEVYGGRVVWPGHLAGEVFDAFRELTAEAPPELTLWLNRLQFPGAPPMVALDIAYLGEAGEGQALLSRLDKIDGVIADRRGVVPVADLGSIADEPTDPGPGLSRAELLTGLDDAVVEILLSEPIDPLVNVQLRHLGGALAEPASSAIGAVSEPYQLSMVGLALGPELARAVTEKQSRLAEQVGEHVSGRKLYTFLSRGESAAAAFPEETLGRLREIKRARDPRHTIRANYPVLG